MNPITNLSTDWHRHSLGAGYRRGWYSSSDIGNRIDDCRLTRDASNGLARRYTAVLDRMERQSDLETFSENLEDRYHNRGHRSIATDCSDGEEGPMAYSSMSARDPIFWVWHKHLDVIFQHYKDTNQRR